MKTLPRRVFNSPLVQFANFADGSHINLIRLKNPSPLGPAWAIHNTTKNNKGQSGMYKTHFQAKNKFDLMVQSASKQTELLNQGSTGN